MRILMVGADYPPGGRGGTDVHMQQLARALRARGHEVHVFCRMGAADVPEYALREEEVEGVGVTRVNYLFSDARGFEWILDNARMDELFEGLISSVEPDLVHVHHLTGLSTGILDRCRVLDVPVVMTLHDHWMVCLRGQRITPELEICNTLDRSRCAPCLKRLWPHFEISAATLERTDEKILARLAACDLLISPSRFHAQRFRDLGLAPEGIRVIPHGLDHGLVPPRETLRWPPRRIGFIGTVIPSKGVHILVEAFNRMGRRDLSLHIHGEAPPFHGDTGYLDRLRSLAREDLSISFHGGYDQAALPDILGSLDVLVVPGLWWEAFCLTIREAMLSGLPVLASDLGAMHEALADLDEDVLFRPGDPEDLVWKLDALLTDEPRYRRLSRLRGRVRGLEEMAAETERAYLEVARDGALERAHRPYLERWKRKGTERPYVTVFIPTWNGGPLFERVLDRVRAQETDFEYEVLCIDSGSRDGTTQVIEARPDVRLIRIPNEEFNHGLTRNRAVREARGEIVVLLTQDAEPLDEHWLQRLVDNFDDPTVAGAYCHQLPRPSCNPFLRERLRGWTRGEGKRLRKRLRDPRLFEELAPMERYRLIAFDDVASAVRKSVMEEIPFEKRQFGEDVCWGRAAILAGHTLVMDPGAVVIHSHDSPISYEFKRVYLDHQNLNDLVGLKTVPSFLHVLKFSVHLTGKLLPLVFKDERPLPQKLLWALKTPWYAFTQNLAQYLGARSNERRERPLWRRFDRRMRRGV